jgi:hypothetical protein
MGKIGLPGKADLSLVDLGGKDIGFFNEFNVGLGPIGKDLIDDGINADHGFLKK